MAETPIDKVHVVNRALVKLGQAPTFSLDAENSLAGKIDLVWPGCVAICFSLHDWTFCRKTFRLTKLDGAPDTGFAKRFQLPGGRIGESLKVLADPRRDAALRDYTIEAQELHADVDAVWVRCKVEVDPVAWDVGFRAAFVVALAGMLAVPMQSDQDLAESYMKEAFGTPSQGGTGGLFGRLISQNLAADPPDSSSRWSDPLTDARYA